MTDHDAKIIDIEKARRDIRARQTTAGRQGASLKGGPRSGANGRWAGSGGPQSPTRKIMMWVQFGLFLVVMAYMMRLCQGR